MSCKYFFERVGQLAQLVTCTSLIPKGFGLSPVAAEVHYLFRELHYWTNIS